MALSEFRHGPDIAACAAHEAQAVALALDRLDEVLAPPAEADDAGIDHRMSIAQVPMLKTGDHGTSTVSGARCPSSMTCVMMHVCLRQGASSYRYVRR